jgi:hypothetical protein
LQELTLLQGIRGSCTGKGCYRYKEVSAGMGMQVSQWEMVALKMGQNVFMGKENNTLFEGEKR